MADTYSLVTEKIAAALEAGTVPWQQPWAAVGGMPRNFVSRRPYRGLNVILLALGTPYAQPWWLTYRQAAALGGHVRPGEKASVVTFWKLPDGKPAERAAASDGADTGVGEEATPRAPLLRHYFVFNVAQCAGLPAPPAPDFTPTPHERLSWCEQVVGGMPRAPEIRTGYDRAFYSPAVDYVGMPDLDHFRSAEDYYATLFHELVHSTGHPLRLDRPGATQPAPFGSPDYSREELVAELGAAFLSGHTGIFPRTAENQAAYVAGWLAALRGDKRLLPIAAAQAQRAADFILQTPPPEPREQPAG